MNHRCPRCRMEFGDRKPEGVRKVETCRCPECNRVFSHARKGSKVAVWTDTEE